MSLIQVVPKKNGVTTISNENREIIFTRTTTTWRLYFDYQKLNQVMRKDYFPLYFLGHVTKRVTGYEFYYYLDSYSRYY